MIKKKHFLFTWLAMVAAFVVSLLLLSLSTQAQSSSSFITTWKTDNPGGSGRNQITIPVNENEDYDYTVEWGDGQSDAGVGGTITHTYAVPGVYTVKIQGTFPRIQFSNMGDKYKILSVEQWGDIVWSSAESAFDGASNLVINAVDAPNLSQVRNASYMFRNAKSVNGGFENWNTGSIQVFSRMFSGATSFNGNISSWNMSQAFNTEYMFSQAIAFNQNINAWNMENIGVMRGMFSGAISFNQTVDSWNLSRVFNVEDVFRNAASYDKSFGNWNIGSIQYINGLLSGASLSTDQYDIMLQTWRQNQTARNLVINAGRSTYCQSSEARDYLINTLGWTITDGGADNVFCGAVEVNFIGVPYIEESVPVNTFISELTVSASINGDFTLSLNCSNGSPDTSFFTLRDNKLYTNALFDYENPLDENTDNSYEICILVSNSTGQSAEKYVLVAVGDIDDNGQNFSGPVTGNNGSQQNGNQGQTLGGQTENNAGEGGRVLGAVLAATGAAVGLLGIYIGLLLSGVTIFGFPKRKLPEKLRLRK